MFWFWVNDKLTNYQNTIVKVPCTVKRYSHNDTRKIFSSIVHPLPTKRLMGVSCMSLARPKSVGFASILDKSMMIFSGLMCWWSTPYPSLCIAASRMFLKNWHPSSSDKRITLVDMVEQVGRLLRTLDYKREVVFVGENVRQLDDVRVVNTALIESFKGGKGQR